MSEFSSLVLSFISGFSRSEPLVLFPTIMAIIIGSFSYFGFFYNFYRPKLPEKPFLSFQGMVFIFGYLFAFVWFTETFIFPLLSGHTLLISSVIIILIALYLLGFKTSLISIIVVAILTILLRYTNHLAFLTGHETISIISVATTFVYLALITLSGVRKCEAAENSMEYKSLYELEWVSKFLTLESLQEIFRRNSNSSISLVSYFERLGNTYRDVFKEAYKNIKEKSKSKLSVSEELGYLLLNIIMFGPPKLILLFVLAYLDFSIEDLSLILGILLFSSIFIALTLISMERGITADIFRYAKVVIVRGLGPKNLSGRIKRMDKEGVQLLVKHSDNSVHLEYIPMDNIIQVELIRWPMSFGK